MREQGRKERIREGEESERERLRERGLKSKEKKRQLEREREGGRERGGTWWFLHPTILS